MTCGGSTQKSANHEPKCMENMMLGSIMDSAHMTNILSVLAHKVDAESCVIQSV
jgi:hypothetical protein